jgi:hypothetical protein
VDYDAEAWINNTVNQQKNHQRMGIIPAGKSFGTNNQPNEEEYCSQLFPGTKNVTELTNSSHESVGGRLFTPNTDNSYYMNKPITQIKETDGLISFKFMGGTDNAIPSINADGIQTKPEYFTLNGIKVEAPTLPGIYIMRQGNVSKKIQIR